MPELKTYDLFISHAWKYDDDYTRIVNLLNNASNFKWRNYSVPQHDPKIDPSKPEGKKTLQQGLANQISPVNCVLVLAGMYVAYSDWIQFEIDTALSYTSPKPIIGVRPWGQERVPTAVSDVAKEVVGWNTDSIVSAIRKYSL